MSSPPKRWYRIIQDDLSAIPDALNWYIQELDSAHKIIDISGTLMSANQNQPGFIAYYDAMHTDLDSILELVQQKYKILRANALRSIADNPPTNVKLSVSDIKLLAECDPEVVTFEQIVNEVKYVYRQYSSLLKALEQRGYTLNNITKIRIAGLEEVLI